MRLSRGAFVCFRLEFAFAQIMRGKSLLLGNRVNGGGKAEVSETGSAVQAGGESI